MSLREKLQSIGHEDRAADLYKRFGIHENPFPASNQTSDNPHYILDEDDEAERLIVAFFRDRRSQVVVIEGTQGVGKTNFLNHFESEIRSALSDMKGYYVVRYLADPEASFEGTTRRLFEELGANHLRKLVKRLRKDSAPVVKARGHDMRTALYQLIASDNDDDIDLMMQWLLGLRLLKAHRQALGVQFRLDTVESKTAALRDMVQVSGSAGVLNGIFLLLDELEKQDGVLGPRAIVRYLSAIRAIVDALPERLFMMIAITPDALIRYSAALPALRGRLLNRIELKSLTDVGTAWKLASFYMDTARRNAGNALKNFPVHGHRNEKPSILKERDVEKCYKKLNERAQQRGDPGVRQREFLHELHVRVEEVLAQRL